MMYWRSTPASIPKLSVILGYLPIAPLVIAAIGVWFVQAGGFMLLVEAAILWSAILFFFLAGVRRGLSFFTEGGPHPAQIITMFWLFGLGLVVLLSPYSGVSVAVAAIGFASIALLDPRAAFRGEVPDFFRALRPPQMGLATVSMLSVFLSLWTSTL
ncbi:DUF3429 domain-containing protein [Salinisphaera sp. SPP-AMP-43]|uniref:DUF3429 domain-containing protein n=1 Tax=Salinisphaera sp. SPP-AMP-43 TaxID=3121288 RepID=UPI003C6E7C7F